MKPFLSQVRRAQGKGKSEHSGRGGEVQLLFVHHEEGILWGRILSSLLGSDEQRRDGRRNRGLYDFVGGSKINQVSPKYHLHFLNQFL